jgi:hypothetical protein
MGDNGMHTRNVLASRVVRTICWSIIPGLFMTVLSNPDGGREFPHTFRETRGAIQPPVQWVPSLFPVGKAAGAWR